MLLFQLRAIWNFSTIFHFLQSVHGYAVLVKWSRDKFFSSGCFFSIIAIFAVLGKLVNFFSPFLSVFWVFVSSQWNRGFVPCFTRGWIGEFLVSPGVSALNTFVPHSFHPFIVHSATLLFSTFSVSFCRLRLCSPCGSLGKKESHLRWFPGKKRRRRRCHRAQRQRRSRGRHRGVVGEGDLMLLFPSREFHDDWLFFWWRCGGLACLWLVHGFA